MTTLLKASLLLLLLPAWSWAQPDAGSEMPFSLGIDARANGMGGGYTSLSSDPGAVYHNPAALALLEYQELALMHTQLFAGTLYDAASWVFPIAESQGIGIGYMRIGTGEIVRYEDYVETGEFDYSHSQFLVSYGRTLFHGLGVGGSIKVVRQSVAEFSDFGYGLDIGLKSRLTSKLFFGLIARNIVGAEVKLDQTPEEAPASITGGIAYRAELAKTVALTLAADLEKVERRKTKVLAGAELLFSERYAIRGGYLRESPVIGAGLNLGRLQFDYAYRIIDVIGDSHFFTLSLRFGQSKTEKLVARERELRERSTAQDRRLRFSQNKDKADLFFDAFQLDSALVYYQRALAFDEDNQDVIGTIAAIENARTVQAKREEELRRTEAEMQQSIRLYYDQATQMYGRGFYRPALDLLQLIFDIQPDNSQAIALRNEISTAITKEIAVSLAQGDSALAQSQTTRAVDAYNRVLDLDSSNARALAGKRQALTGFDYAQQLNAAIELFNQKQFDAAARRFRAVLEVNPGDRLAKEYLDRMNTPQQQRTSNLEDLQKDRVYWPMYLEGLRLMRNKQYDAAIAVWKKVLEAYPNQENTLNNIEQARLRIQTGDSDGN